MSRAEHNTVSVAVFLIDAPNEYEGQNPLLYP